MSKVKDANPCGLRDRVGAADGVEFVEQRRNVIFRGMRRNAKLASDQLVRRALRQQRKHFQLTGRERNVANRLRRGNDEQIMIVVAADKLEPFDIRQRGGNSVGESGIGDLDGQSERISRGEVFQAEGLSPI